VVEAMNTRGEEFGETRLLANIATAMSVSPSQMMNHIMMELDRFVGNTPQHDDVTCLLLKMV
jgi:sigma-B regulation protein RsbU (phosphoserine phosphatase)